MIELSTPADQVNRQSPTPSQGNGEGTDLRSVANKIEGLLDDDGHFNPDPGQLSRSHPDYDPDTDPRNNSEGGQGRDERGRFKGKQAAAEGSDETVERTDPGATDDQDAAGDEQTEDDEQQLDTAATDTDDAQTTSADDATTEETETGDDIQTLAQLAEALETPIEELKQALTHTFNAADEEVTVTLEELEAGYQKDADYRRQTGKLAEDRRAAETVYQNNMQQFEQAHTVTAQAYNVAEQLLGHELNDPRLAQLRDSDPAEWTARRDEIGQRVGQLRQARQQAAQQYEQFRNQNRAQLKEREGVSLKEKIPDFGSEHVRIARSTMESLGYQTPEIAEIFDHRLVMGALELAVLRQEVQTLRGEKTKAADAVKRIKKDVPKLQKPGKRQMKGKGIKRDNVKRLHERAKKSGSVDDAAKVIESMMG